MTSDISNMKLKRTTTINIDKESLGEIIEKFFKEKGYGAIHSVSFDMIFEYGDPKLVGVTAVIEDLVNYE